MIKNPNPQLPNCRRLLAFRAVSCIYVGPYSEMLPAYLSLEAYAQRHGLLLRGISMEEYLIGATMTANPQNYVTRIYLPIAERGRDTTTFVEGRLPRRGLRRLGGRRALPACVVDGVVGAVFPVQNQLADGDDLIALSQQIFQDVAGFRCMEGGALWAILPTWGHAGGHPRWR